MMTKKTSKLIVGLAIAAVIVAIAIGQPRPFTDPITHADGGVLATWGPITCAIWTWSGPQVVNSYVVPINCSRT